MLVLSMLDYSQAQCLLCVIIIKIIDHTNWSKVVIVTTSRIISVLYSWQRKHASYTAFLK